MKENKGITLIALIITIIILIILAGISIAVLTGEDGLITKTKQARQNMENATIEEQERLNTLYAEMDSQLTTGSTNNSGTPVNQGSTTVTTTGGGLTQEEHDALMRTLNNTNKLASYTPNMYDINPNKEVGDKGLYVCDNDPNDTVFLPICGYKKLSLYNRPTYGNKTFFAFVYSDGSIGNYNQLTTDGTWSNFDISDDTVGIKTYTTHTSGYLSVYYALYTADSPYNPDNQH